MPQLKIAGIFETEELANNFINQQTIKLIYQYTVEVNDDLLSTIESKTLVNRPLSKKAKVVVMEISEYQIGEIQILVNNMGGQYIPPEQLYSWNIYNL
jgi:hypothetical protein